MNKISAFVLRYLSTLVFIAIYLVLFIFHMFLEGFVPEIQLDMLLTMVPLILLGVILDYIVNRNNVLSNGYKLFTQILPAGVFVLIGLSSIFEIAGREKVDLFNYLVYLFLTVPFFIVSYNKTGHKNKMIFSLIGTGLVAAAYLYLTTLTAELNEGTGLVIYLIAYFSMFYAASGLRKMPYLSIILGAANASILILIYKFPVTDTAKTYGWDYDIAQNFSILMLEFFVLCILICLLAVIRDKQGEEVK